LITCVGVVVACTDCRGAAQDIMYRPGTDAGPRDEAMYAAVCAWNTRAVPCSEDDTRL
jgi:hypothetical protein